MKKLQIILDSDEVIVRNIPDVLALYNQEYEDTLTQENLLDWDLTKFTKEGSDIVKYFSNPGFFRQLPIMEDAQFYIKQLLADGHDIVIATASPKEGILDKIEFYQEHFPFIPITNIIPISRKDLLTGDIMLDDAPHNLKTSKCTYPVVFDCQWNRNTEGDYAFMKELNRVTSWKEFYDFATKVAMQEEVVVS